MTPDENTYYADGCKTVTANAGTEVTLGEWVITRDVISRLGDLVRGGETLDSDETAA